MRLAAIDIGSNAARLLVSDVTIYKDGSPDFAKVNLVRVPLRLGFDVFERGSISEQKKDELLETMKAFAHLLQVYKPKGIKICATSAMRDAKNGKQIAALIEEKTGLAIRIISGEEEAGILYDTHLADNLDPGNSYLYIDVGGGSTELTHYAHQQKMESLSFNIGTIRLLKNQVEDALWDDMKAFVKSLRSEEPLVAIGSGGNINKVFSLSKKKADKPLSIDVLKDYYKELQALTVAERIHRFQLREDRADVIVPALSIYLSVMKWGDIKEIFVPQIGLVDGLIRSLFQELHFTSLKAIHP